ncbi:MAG: hypothetical protein WCK16_00910 [Candidatus Moraniibacteriota bacterium]
MHHKVYWQDAQRCADNRTYFTPMIEFSREIFRKFITSEVATHIHVQKHKWIEIHTHKNNEVIAQC